jgi:hypothetical protein
MLFGSKRQKESRSSSAATRLSQLTFLIHPLAFSNYSARDVFHYLEGEQT